MAKTCEYWQFLRMMCISFQLLCLQTSLVPLTGRFPGMKPLWAMTHLSSLVLQTATFPTPAAHLVAPSTQKPVTVAATVE